MPLLNFELVDGVYIPIEIKQILDIAYEVVLSVFKTPKGDRYQVVHLNNPEYLIMEDTGLGFQRSNRRILLNIRTSPRTDEQKLEFFKTLATRLNQELGVSQNDLMIDMVGNNPVDWSFRNGEAQFITGEL